MEEHTLNFINIYVLVSSSRERVLPLHRIKSGPSSFCCFISNFREKAESWLLYLTELYANLEVHFGKPLNAQPLYLPRMSPSFGLSIVTLSFKVQLLPFLSRNLSPNYFSPLHYFSKCGAGVE